MSLAFQLHTELGEERDGGVQIVDDGANVVHPLNGHACQRTDAASRQSGAERTGGSAGLKVMPVDSVTLSDGSDPGERARGAADLYEAVPTARAGDEAQNRSFCTQRCPLCLQAARSL